MNITRYSMAGVCALGLGLGAVGLPTLAMADRGGVTTERAQRYHANHPPRRGGVVPGPRDNYAPPGGIDGGPRGYPRPGGADGSSPWNNWNRWGRWHHGNWNQPQPRDVIIDNKWPPTVRRYYPPENRWVPDPPNCMNGYYPCRVNRNW